jgi:hypothetical protein
MRFGMRWGEGRLKRLLDALLPERRFFGCVVWGVGLSLLC